MDPSQTSNAQPAWLSEMVDAGKNVPSQTQTQTDQPAWLTEMVNAGNTPAQSAAVLGHATSQMQKTFQSPLQNIQAGQSDANVEVAKGAGKQALSDFSSAGAQNAGPVGAAMMQNAPGFQQDIQGLQQGVKPSNPAQATGAAGTSLAEMTLGGGEAKSSGLLSSIADKTGLTDYLASRATAKATKAVAATADEMTTTEQKAAALDNRLNTNIKGGFSPSQTENRAGEILSGQLGSNAAKNIPVIQGEIATRGKEAETFLQQNAKPITNEEDLNAFQKQREKSSTYLTPTAVKAYDEQMNVFQGILKGYAEKSGGYNTSNYYQALKEFESNVTQNMPKGVAAMSDEGGSARLQAAKDVRTVVRDMVGQKNPEFKGKMFDLASLYDARDNVVTKAVKADTFAKRFPKTTKALTWGTEAIGAGALYKGAQNIGIPLPNLP